jgi:SAM-dependent methyltransferase
MSKSYDRAYFDRWYRDPRDRVVTRASLERKVRLALSITEFLLMRPVRTVIDVGCGEAAWYTVLRRWRPGVRYIGIDSSEYVLERYGAARHIRRGSFESLHTMRLPRNVDLIVCADVLQYVRTEHVLRGLRAIKALLGGVAYLEAYTSEDAMIGDADGWHDRSGDEYRRLFHRAGLTQCGPYSFVDRASYANLNVFETC